MLVSLGLAVPGRELAGQEPGLPPDPAPTPTAGAAVHRTAFLMGTRLDVRIGGLDDRERLLAASQTVLEEMRRIEELLSTWEATTPLSRANRAPVGEVFPLPAELHRLLESALHWSHRTGGAFEPRVGALVRAWDLRGTGRVPEGATLAHALAVSGDRGMTLTSEGTVRRDARAWIDAGGFGKGAALDAARRLLADHGVNQASLNLGGQLLLVGAPADQPRGWSVSVAHPRRRGATVAALRVRDASVATSSASERTVEVDGGAFGHILDPRTGQPVPAWGSVTVVAENPLAADILSTAFFVLGPDDGMALARSFPEVGALFLEVTATGDVSARWTDPMNQWLVDPAPQATTYSPGRPMRPRP